MDRYLILVSPSANRVFASNAAFLAAQELQICIPDACEAQTKTLAGVDYVAFSHPNLDTTKIANLCATLALFKDCDGLLQPVLAKSTDLLSEDLVSIPKYQGKTNEQFTRLLLNVTLSQVAKPRPRPVVLDPLAGRATTLCLAWTMGCDAAGVEIDTKQVEIFSAYLKTYLRRKRLKHHAALNPVKREGKLLGSRFEAELSGVTPQPLKMNIFTGDTRDSAALYGKRKFDAVVADAPYGVVHGSRSDVRGVSKKDRSAAALLREAIPVWASQLIKGGALGLSWNTLGLARQDLAQIMTDAGLTVRDDETWRKFSHRVDASINRDLMVGVFEG